MSAEQMPEANQDLFLDGLLAKCSEAGVPFINCVSVAAMAIETTPDIAEDAQS